MKHATGMETCTKIYVLFIFNLRIRKTSLFYFTIWWRRCETHLLKSTFYCPLDDQKTLKNEPAFWLNRYKQITSAFLITNYDKVLTIATGSRNYDKIITNYDKTVSSKYNFKKLHFNQNLSI